jgi:acyl carrier protein
VPCTIKKLGFAQNFTGGLKIMAEIEGKVIEIISELLGVDTNEINREASFRDDLEADSLDLVELIMRFEEEFGGEISDEEAQNIKTVGEAIDFIKEKM